MDHRLYARVPVEPQGRAELHFKQQAFRDVPVVNVGVEGCCLRLSDQLAQYLKNNLSIDHLELIHPSLPQAPVKGTLAWIRGGGGQAAAGIRFTGAPGGFTGQVAAFVRDWAKYDRLTSGLDNLPA